MIETPAGPKLVCRDCAEVFNIAVGVVDEERNVLDVLRGYDDDND